MKGSMTVEAVFVISLILLIILWIMKETIFLYQETAEMAGKSWLNLEDAASTFRRIFLGRELLP